ncbi:MAG: efflux RND transporter periplasmic adaptor subunit [Butyricicoccaceae bacterium]
MAATATVNAGTAGVIYPAESGSLEYISEIAVTSKVSGTITAYSGTGNYSAGAAIMRMTSDALQDEVKNAQSSISSAQSTVVSAQTAVADKQARISELQLLIAQATVVSPIDGVVVTMNAVEDQEVSGADPLVVVADLSNIIVNASIMSTDMGAVQTGQPAIMSMYATRMARSLN